MAVEICTANFEDPRFSRPQVAAITRTCEADSGALLLGLDRNLRPVVTALVGIPQVWRTWAILRNGDPLPAEIDEHGHAVLLEPWGAAVVRDGLRAAPTLTAAGEAL